MAVGATVAASRGRVFCNALFALALVLACRALPAAADELAEFHAAVDRATADYRAALQTLDTRGRDETASAVSRFRRSWQAVIDHFSGHHLAALADDQTLGATFTQVDAGIVGALIVIDLGSREAVRAALEPIGQTLDDLAARSAPATK
jgi:hypothetical protein